MSDDDSMCKKGQKFVTLLIFHFLVLLGGAKKKACLQHISCMVCNVKNDFYDITCLCQRQNPGFVSFGRIVTVSEMVHFSM